MLVSFCTLTLKIPLGANVIQEHVVCGPIIYSSLIQDSDDEDGEDGAGEDGESERRRLEFGGRSSPLIQEDQSEPEMTEEEKEFQLVCSRKPLS